MRGVTTSNGAAIPGTAPDEKIARPRLILYRLSVPSNPEAFRNAEHQRPAPHSAMGGAGLHYSGVYFENPRDLAQVCENEGHLQLCQNGEAQENYVAKVTFTRTDQLVSLPPRGCNRTMYGAANIGKIFMRAALDLSDVAIEIVPLEAFLKQLNISAERDRVSVAVVTAANAGSSAPTASTARHATPGTGPDAQASAAAAAPPARLTSP